MIGRSVIHDTFTIERTYLATPSRVFAAFASATILNFRAEGDWRMRTFPVPAVAPQLAGRPRIDEFRAGRGRIVLVDRGHR